MNCTVVIINGLSCSGKSTFVGLCKRYVQEEHMDCGITEISTVDFVKKIALECGWSGKKNHKDRTFLSDLKNLLTQWGNVPINKVFESIERICRTSELQQNIVFVNSREPEDIDKIKEISISNGYKVHTLFIERDGAGADEVDEIKSNINNYHYDDTIRNGGTLSQLFLSAKEYIDYIKD